MKNEREEGEGEDEWEGEVEGEGGGEREGMRTKAIKGDWRGLEAALGVDGAAFNVGDGWNGGEIGALGVESSTEHDDGDEMGGMDCTPLLEEEWDEVVQGLGKREEGVWMRRDAMERKMKNETRGNGERRKERETFSKCSWPSREYSHISRDILKMNEA